LFVTSGSASFAVTSAMFVMNPVAVGITTTRIFARRCFLRSPRSQLRVPSTSEQEPRRENEDTKSSLRAAIDQRHTSRPFRTAAPNRDPVSERASDPCRISPILLADLEICVFARSRSLHSRRGGRGVVARRWVRGRGRHRGGVRQTGIGGGRGHDDVLGRIRAVVERPEVAGDDPRGVDAASIGRLEGHAGGQRVAHAHPRGRIRPAVPSASVALRR
jgi:hypothetical protein